MPTVLVPLFQLRSGGLEHDQSTARDLVKWVIPNFDRRIDVTAVAVKRTR